MKVSVHTECRLTTKSHAISHGHVLYGRNYQLSQTKIKKRYNTVGTHGKCEFSNMND